MGLTVLMSIEGVLVREDESWSTGQPLHEGRLFYASLVRDWRVILYSARNEGERGNEWLRMSGFREHASVLVSTTDDPRADVVERMLVQATGRLQERVNLVVDPDPSVIPRVMSRGIVGLLWAHPQYALPGNRPEGRGVRAWQEITEEMDRQREERKRVDAMLEPERSEEAQFEEE